MSKEKDMSNYDATTHSLDQLSIESRNKNLGADNSENFSSESKKPQKGVSMLEGKRSKSSMHVPSTGSGGTTHAQQYNANFSRGSTKNKSSSPTANKGKTIVIKLGTSSICDPVTHVPLFSILYAVVETIIKLKEQGHQVVLVSSGAVGIGLRRLNIPVKPKRLDHIQAVAAVGQGRLMALYDTMFSQIDQPIAQVLLTRKMGVIPIVNENDTVSLGEIRFGDNDTLSAITAGMIRADFLFLLTDVDFLYTNNPRNDPNAKPVYVVDDMGKLVGSVDASSAGSAVGTGGMATKLIAAELAMAAGVCTIITNSTKPRRILDIIDYFSDPAHLHDKNAPPEDVMCTRFIPCISRMRDKKWWIMHGMRCTGTLYVDFGAFIAVAKNKKSLFAAGISSISDDFESAQAVKLVYKHTDGSEYEIGRGLVNYSSHEINRIRGLHSKELEQVLGYVGPEEIIHRGNMVISITPQVIDSVSLSL
ncbi:putative glutamate 5-kinase [Zancudomyces culisetae]|uniref:Putative glutamate 5-kinase n=1 Tax=Zancudomyces culisetae TaxID=1213189 RepID=A0A1R1PDQ2_ZANCU|nr:putative glutamate 5-kinase [Zancudomyces culisetae]|eukprot:OMH79096.1 putative glutamate 5-kinase [Zancudomyces culisetae]